ncbi:MAG: chemotaxis protein CheW [Rhodoferax sp.]|nr:chemotaxis protein CheW [Rhodoferax sp.]MDP3650311.1 chemotaxis protein CheW [Rhodoferax sp.]
MTQSNPSMVESVLALRREFDLSFAQAPRMETEQRASLLAIRIGGDPYAIRVSDIDGIHAGCHIMPLPTPIPELLGVAGFRGQIVPVYDLAALLGYARAVSPRWLVLLWQREHEAVALAFETFEMHFSVSQAHIVQAPNAISSPPGQPRPHVFDVVSDTDTVRPVIQLQSLLSGIQKQVDSTVQHRSVLP